MRYITNLRSYNYTEPVGLWCSRFGERCKDIGSGGEEGKRMVEKYLTIQI